MNNGHPIYNFLVTQCGFDHKIIETAYKSKADLYTWNVLSLGKQIPKLEIIFINSNKGTDIIIHCSIYNMSLTNEAIKMAYYPIFLQVAFLEEQQNQLVLNPDKSYLYFRSRKYFEGNITLDQFIETLNPILFYLDNIYISLLGITLPIWNFIPKIITEYPTTFKQLARIQHAIGFCSDTGISWQSNNPTRYPATLLENCKYDAYEREEIDLQIGINCNNGVYLCFCQNIGLLDIFPTHFTVNFLEDILITFHEEPCLKDFQIVILNTNSYVLLRNILFHEGLNLKNEFLKFSKDRSVLIEKLGLNKYLKSVNN